MSVPTGRTALLRPNVIGVEPDGRTLTLELSLADAELWAILREVPEAEREEYVLRALKVGFLALRDARTVARADYVEKEFQRMRHEFQTHLEQMFGKGGEVTQRIHQVFGDKGELDEKLRSFFGPQGRFESLLERYVGEDGQMRRALDETVGKEGDFHRTLDDFFGESGELRRALDSEFGRDGGRLYRILNPRDETTPLGEFRKALDDRFIQLREELLKQMADIRDSLGVQKGQKSERDRSTLGGRDFEEEIFQRTRQMGQARGDRILDVRTEAGRLAPSKVGDVVIEIDRSATQGLQRRIVVEAKRESVSFKGKESIFTVLDEALKNRDAQVAIAAVDAASMGHLSPLEFYPPDHIVVAVDREDEESVALSSAYGLARALAVAKAGSKELTMDVNALRGRIGEVRRELEKIQALRTSLSAAESGIKKAYDLSGEIRERVARVLESLEKDLQSGSPGSSPEQG